MRVKLYFSVSRKGLPAVLTVRNFDGEILFYKVIFTKENVVCFNTCGSRNIIVAVRPYNADFYESSQFIKLPCARCYRLYLSFNFVKRNFNLLHINACFFKLSFCFCTFSFTAADSGCFFKKIAAVFWLA